MLVCFTLLVSIISSPCLSQFTEGTATTSQPSCFTAVAYDTNNDVLLFGSGTSRLYSQQFVMFQNDVFIDVNQSYLVAPEWPGPVWYCGAQQYTQLNGVLWMIRPHSFGNTFITVDTQSYATNYPAITIPYNAHFSACITSAEDNYLIVVGGGYMVSETLDTLQIYDINEAEWLQNLPSLVEAKQKTSCLAVADMLYVIGGVSATAYLDDIEVLDISNIASISSQLWQYLPGRLSVPLIGTRAVMYGTDIIVIGGEGSDTRAVDLVHIITETGDCLVADSLAFAVSHAVSIIIGNVLCAFGGKIFSKGTSVATDQYQCTILQTLKPTPQYPTSSPLVPTVSPTSIPTVTPSSEPIRYSTSVIPNSTIYPLNVMYSTSYTISYPSYNPTTDSVVLSSTTSQVLKDGAVGDDELSTINTKTAQIQSNNTEWNDVVFAVLCVSVVYMICFCIIGILYKRRKKQQQRMEQTVNALKKSNAITDVQLSEIMPDIDEPQIQPHKNVETAVNIVLGEQNDEKNGMEVNLESSEEDEGNDIDDLYKNVEDIAEGTTTEGVHTSGSVNNAKQIDLNEQQEQITTQHVQYHQNIPSDEATISGGHIL